IISSAEMLFFEGYLFDNPKSKKAVQKAIQLAKKLGTKIAFTASDPNCIKRHQADFLEIIRHYADVIFANEAEAEAIFDEKDLRKNLYNFITLNATSCITRGEAGSYIVQDEKIYDIEAVKVNDVYDVTGAGDAYAAGVLYGYLYGLSPEKYGKLGSLSAAEVIKYLGGRPNTDLSQLLNKI
ncbi:MAG: PfkB family carbohydrate kinase, partial [Rickettsiales bacterium]|nr:PfkB family carbohydrate kinase [Rickettsiales bacterium]